MLILWKGVYLLGIFDLIMKEVVLGIIFRKNIEDKEYLFISANKDFGKFTGLLYPPGGHVEKGEGYKDTLIREVNEELGIIIKPTKLLAKTGSDVANQVTYWLECKEIPFNTTIVRDKKEIASAKWMTEEMIQKNKGLFWPTTFDLFTKYLKNSF